MCLCCCLGEVYVGRSSWFWSCSPVVVVEQFAYPLEGSAMPPSRSGSSVAILSPLVRALYCLRVTAQRGVERRVFLVMVYVCRSYRSHRTPDKSSPLRNENGANTKRHVSGQLLYAWTRSFERHPSRH